MLKGRRSNREDYRNDQHWNKGHMAPKADMKWSVQAYEESFYLTNICPQNHPFNAGIWSSTEKMAHWIARQYGVVYIICGPIFTDNHYGTLGESRVAIPDRFYKALLIQTEHGFSPHHQWGFYMGGYEAELSQRVKDGSVMSAFAQNMIVYHGVRQSMAWRMHNGKYDVFRYRALCEAGDNLYVVESEKAMPYDQFVDKLVNLNVRHALYLDMGSYNICGAARLFIGNSLSMMI